MKLTSILLLFSIVTGSSYACNNDGVRRSVESDHGKVLQIFSSERATPGSTIFFHYLNASDEHPDVKASFVPDRCNPNSSVIFDSFSFDGSAANIESVFWGKGKYKKNLFIIVSWVYNLDGVSTVGKYYSVFAYYYNKNNLIKDSQLSSIFENGQDGFVDGKVVKYKFKTAGDIWSYLSDR